MKIGIGIDTGGTYTDVVAFDFTDKKVLSKGKALTTRENLSIGINKALDLLPQEYIQKASIVSLSTTLSTNACIEDKGCRAKLIVFGMTDELLSRFKGEEKYGISREAVRCVDTNSSADGLYVDEAGRARRGRLSGRRDMAGKLGAALARQLKEGWLCPEK